MKQHSETMWAILGICDGKPMLYIGTWILRSDAILNHSMMQGRTWPECRRKGDRAVKVRVTVLK